MQYSTIAAGDESAAVPSVQAFSVAVAVASSLPTLAASVSEDVSPCVLWFSLKSTTLQPLGGPGLHEGLHSREVGKLANCKEVRSLLEHMGWQRWS